MADQVGVGMPLELRHHRGQLLAMPQVVAVEQRDVRRRRRPHAGVARRSHAAILLAHDPSGHRVPREIRPGDLARGVARTVVHDDGLMVRERLRANGVERPLDERGGVIRRTIETAGLMRGGASTGAA
jgi:hypothetical protein